MRCPWCAKEIHFNHAKPPTGVLTIERSHDERHEFGGGMCPACRGIFVTHYLTKRDPEDNHPLNPRWGQTHFLGCIYPKGAARKPLPPEVPNEYRPDYEEACAVLEISPKASAALSRRLLQAILHERFSINKPNLQQEIQEFISTLTPPTHLAQQLDAVRVIGNFAAHPMKDTNTGAIADVEEGEAGLLVETLDIMFDYAFVQPAKWSAVKAAINAKLRAVGKPEIP
jgi:hypothetical protein